MRKRYWLPPMLRTVLDFIDQQKGEHSIFIHDDEEAYKQTIEKLKSTTDTDVHEKLTRDNVETKIRKQAQRAGLASADLNHLFIQGSIVLDIAKLKGVYTDAEIADRERQSGLEASTKPLTLKIAPKKLKSKPAEDTISLKRKAEVFEDGWEEDDIEDMQYAGADASEPESDGDNGDDEEDVNDLDYNGEDISQPVKIRAKKKQQNPSSSQTTKISTSQDLASTKLPAKKIKPANQQAATTDGSTATIIDQNIAKPNTQDTRKIPEEFVCAHCNTRFPSKTFDEHMHIHFRESLPYGTYVCPMEGCRAYFACTKDLANHVRMHEEHNTLRASLESNAARQASPQDTNVSGYTQGELQIISFMRRGETADHEDVGQIIFVMQDIQNKIYAHTLDFFSDANIEEAVWPHVYRNQCDKALDDLLFTLFGKSIEGVSKLQWKWEKVHDYIQALELVTALIGAAVTSWALIPQPLAGVDNGFFKLYAEVLSEKSEALQDHIMELATKRYLQARTKPEIARVSDGLAHMLIDILQPVFKGIKKRGIEDLPILVAVTSAGSQQVLEGLPYTSMQLDASDPCIRFERRLARVFEQALTLRVGMEEHGHADYTFNMPHSSDQLDFKEHAVRDKKNNQEISRATLYQQAGIRQANNTRHPDRRVKIALFPCLQARFKETREGSWGTKKVLVKAQVLLWNAQ